MIIKKPYAFMIKHFKTIHLILSLLLIFLAVKTNKVFVFFNDYMKNGYYQYSANLTNNYINFYMFIAIIIIILISAFIYLLMKWKQKSRTLYISMICFYLALFIGFLVYFNAFNTLSSTAMQPRTIRAYRDIILLIYLPQYIFIIINLVRGVGFDIKKFDFRKDLEELDIAEEDQEEIEVTLGDNTYKIKRNIRKAIRELKYYAVENKFFFGAICGVVTLVIAFLVYLEVFVYNKKFKETDYFNVNGITFKVNNSYITDTDYRGKTIVKGKRYIVINVNMKNNLTTKGVLKTDNLRLMLDGKNYYPTYSKNDYFIDLGEGYYKNTLSPNEEKEYLLIYEVPADIIYNHAVFRMVQDVSIKRGEIAARYKDVTLDIKELLTNDKINKYNMEEGISLEDTTLKESELLIKSYSISDSFIETYEYCTTTCHTGSKNIKPNVMGQKNRTLMKLNIELDLDKSLYINRFLKQNSDFIKRFATITYTYDGYTKTTDVLVKDLGDIKTNNIYIEVPSEIKKTSSIKLNITIRNKKYLIILQ